MSTISASTTTTTAYKVTADTTGTLVLQTGATPTTAVTIDGSQNVGVGVTPSAWGAPLGAGVVQLAGGSSVAALSLATYNSGSVASGYIASNAYFNGTNWIYHKSNYATLYEINSNSGKHIWNTAASGTAGNAITFTQAMTLDASSILNIGNTTNAVAGGVAIIPNSSNSLIRVGHIAGSGSSSYYANFFYDSSQIGSITQSGTTAVLYNVTSDQRLKENIDDAPEFGSVIDSLQVRSFDWKTDQTHQRAGFIAQELVTVAPEAVHQPADPDDMMAVDYSKLVPMLVKEIQSLRKRLAALENK